MTDRFLLVYRVDGKETAAFPVGFADWQKEMTLSTADLHLDIRRKCRLQITVCEAIDASDKFAVGRCVMAKPLENLTPTCLTKPFLTVETIITRSALRVSRLTQKRNHKDIESPALKDRLIRRLGGFRFFPCAERQPV